MNQAEGTPTQLLGAMLGMMTERAQKAEEERDASLRDSDLWRAAWQKKDNEVKELQEKLSVKVKKTNAKGEEENAQ